MGYSYSNTDRQNLEWFPRDDSRATLLAIRVKRGAIRGISSLDIGFEYPITALAGRNRSGKTTLLALAACAFHSDSQGYKLPGRKHPYYTFSDFFIQAEGEGTLEGITITYRILHNDWLPSPRVPEGRGPAWQSRSKASGGRWTNYDRRVPRPVVYLGIDRVVPHAEKTISKSYRSLFRRVDEQGREEDVRNAVGRILGVQYQAYESRQHSRYRLPVVTHEGVLYSGFNMGAGEDALFGMMSVFRDCPDGSLILIDEIELGLHEEAQTRLIDELKAICLARHVQVICTTHSPTVLARLPPEGRIFIERVGTETRVYPRITPPYAAGKLTGKPHPELDILVEDEVSHLIVEASLDPDLRARVNIMPLGSSIALMRHLAVRYKEARGPGACAILDGDKAGDMPEHLQAFLALVERNEEKEAASEWVSQRVSFLPGTTWPEAWVIDQLGDPMRSRLAHEFGMSHAEINAAFEQARLSGKHNEFRRLAQIFSYEEGILAHQTVKGALESNPADIQTLCAFVRDRLQPQQ